MQRHYHTNYIHTHNIYNIFFRHKVSVTTNTLVGFELETEIEAQCFKCSIHPRWFRIRNGRPSAFSVSSVLSQENKVVISPVKRNAVA